MKNLGINLTKWINKMWNIHTVVYYSAISNEVLIHATRVNHEDMLSERSQTQMVMYSITNVL